MGERAVDCHDPEKERDGQRPEPPLPERRCGRGPGQLVGAAEFGAARRQRQSGWLAHEQRDRKPGQHEHRNAQSEIGVAPAGRTGSHLPKPWTTSSKVKIAPLRMH